MFSSLCPGANTRKRADRASSNRLAFGLVLPLFFLASCAARPPGVPLERYEFTRIRMGVPFRIVLYAESEVSAKGASDAAFARIEKLDRILSDYDPESELMLLCRTAGSATSHAVSEDLFCVLALSSELSKRTAGAFDVTVGPLVALWREARKSKQLPSPERLAKARLAVGYEHLVIDTASARVELRQRQMRLDLGGIAKGYAVDAAVEALAARGVTRALVDGGGDVAVAEPPPGKAGWRIGIASLEGDEPTRFLLLERAAVATSGDAWQAVEIDGVRYSHIVDPRTGLGLTRRSSVTVVAPTCAEADGLATAVSVLGPERGLELIELTAKTAALIIAVEGGRVVTHESRRLGGLRLEREDRYASREKQAMAAAPSGGTVR